MDEYPDNPALTPLIDAVRDIGPCDPQPIWLIDWIGGTLAVMYGCKHCGEVRGAWVSGEASDGAYRLHDAGLDSWIDARVQECPHA